MRGRAPWRRRLWVRLWLGLLAFNGAALVLTAAALMVLDSTTLEGRQAYGYALGVLALVAALSVGSSVVLARRVVRPLEAVSGAARRVALGDLAARTPGAVERREDEIGRLARDFNAMAASLERLEAERRFTSAAIAHELRTPLTALRGLLQAARDGLLTLDERELDGLLAQVGTLSRLTGDLRTLSLAEAGRLGLVWERVDLAELARRALRGIAPAAGQKAVTLTLGGAPALEAEGDGERLGQVLGNLLDNALRHAPPGGRVTVKLRGDANEATIEVSDTGPGLSAEALPRVFERFYRAETSRTRSAGGSGLGLAVVRAVVEGHGGQVSVNNGERGGACFRVVLPVSRPVLAGG